MEDYGRDISLYFAVDSWFFFSSLSYAKNTEIPSYEEGISLFDVEATLQPDGGARHRRKYSFSGAKSAD
ncbi:TPA: hypothetical protein J1289_001150 [Escherichia coli]|nr:hypothetical protein [Escherichia coli]QMJ90980.1 hypothetical protein HVX86_12655 [Escherichia coli]HAH9070320.1 hypothetical protein [Escherichia coli]HAW3741889.1 hypothetical protein [Escherichia coli]HAW4326370.1 hypothetical protein [Escherichia coli]